MHGLRFVALPRFVFILLPAVSLTARAADDTRVLFRFTKDFDITTVEASDTRVSLEGPALRLATGHETTWPGIHLSAPEGSWDLSPFRAIAIDVQNVGDQPVNVHVRIDDKQSNTTQRWITGQVDLEPGARKTVQVELKRKMPDALRGQLFGMRGYPGGWDRDHGIDVTTVVRLILFVNNPAIDHAFTIANVRACGRGGKPPTHDAKELFPLVDRYGQFRHKEWPGKVHHDSDLARNRRNETAALEAQPGPDGWNQYGGWLAGPRLEATGRFRTQKYQGKWSLVDPEGQLFWSHGSDCVGWSSGYTPITDRKHWFAALPAKGSPFGAFHGTAHWAPHGYYHDKGPYETFSFACLNLSRKYGDDWKPAFATLAHRRLRSWGMNTIANWSNRDIYAMRKTPYTASVWFTSKKLGGSKGYWGKFPDPFDRSFAEALDATMVALRKTEVGDPWCLGYFVSNELGWGDDVSLALATLASPADQAAKQVFVADLKTKYATIERLNAAWRTEHASWDALRAARTPPDRHGAPDQHGAHDDLTAFYTKIAEAYFRGCRDAIRRADPKGLYLGCRFSAVNPRAARAAAKYCDIVSYNRYERSVGGLRLPEGCDRPVIIGEFHFGALDRGMLHTGLVETSDQAARGCAYRNYVRSALANPAIVGTHWFQFCDQAVTGRGDGENYQIGLLDVCDTPYAETIEACREIGDTMYRDRWK